MSIIASCQIWTLSCELKEFKRRKAERIKDFRKRLGLPAGQKKKIISQHVARRNQNTCCFPEGWSSPCTPVILEYVFMMLHRLCLSLSVRLGNQQIKKETRRRLSVKEICLEKEAPLLCTCWQASLDFIQTGTQNSFYGALSFPKSKQTWAKIKSIESHSLTHIILGNIVSWKSLVLCLFCYPEVLQKLHIIYGTSDVSKPDSVTHLTQLTNNYLVLLEDLYLQASVVCMRACLWVV